MDIVDSINKFKKEYISLMRCSYNMKSINQNMTYISLSTMTVICDLSCEIDIELLGKNFRSPPYPACILIQAKNHDEYELTKRGRVRKSFYNQATIKFEDHTRKSIKIFSNGRLQMTGLTSLQEAVDVGHIISSVLMNSSNALVEKDYIPKPEKIKIGMINTNFSFSCGLDIILLKSLYMNYPDKIKVIYEPDIYPGLKIKFKTSSNELTSVFIFTTGNVVMTGVKSLNDIQEAFNFIVPIINDNLSKLQTPYAVIKSNKKHYPITNGYPNHMLKCLQ